MPSLTKPLSTARRSPVFFQGLCATAAASTVLLAGHSAFAQVTATYTNGAATSTFNTPANWSTGVVPGNDGTTTTNSPDTAIFPVSILTAPTANAMVTVDTGRNVANITFDLGSPTVNSTFTYTLVGGSLLLSAGGTAQVINGSTAAGATQQSIFNTPISLEGNYTFLDNSANSGAQLRSTNSIAPDATLTAATPVTLTLGGTGPGTINLQSPITNGAGGSVLSVVKTGAGAASLNGANTFSGGVIIQSGSIGLGNTAGLGTGPLTLGSATVGANAMVTAGSGYTPANAINVAGGAGTRTIGGNGGSGATNFAGAITLNNNTAGLTISALTTAATGRDLTISGGITGTGNVTVANTNLGNTIITAKPLNNVGMVSNTGTGTGALSQTTGGTLGSNVTNFTQNSATSTTTFSLANTYGTTTVTAGTLTVGAGGTLGTGSVTVGSGGILTTVAGASLGLGGNFGAGNRVTVSGTGVLTLASSTSFSSTQALLFSGTSTINLNNTTNGSDTLLSITDTDNGSNPLTPGNTYTATQLDAAFGGISTFQGAGSLTIAAVPEPSTWICGLLAAVGTFGFALRRRSGRLG